MKYDDASWHFGGDFPSESPQEYGGTHIGIFLRWCFMKGWAGELHTEEENDAVQAVIQGEMSGTDFLFKYCDGKLTNEDFNNEGNDFASEHYDSFYMSAYCHLFPHQMYVAPESAHDVGRLFQQLDKKAAKNLQSLNRKAASDPRQSSASRSLYRSSLSPNEFTETNRNQQKPALPTKFQLGNRAMVAKKYSEAIRFFEEHANDIPDDYAKCHTKIAECLKQSNVLTEPVDVQPGVELVFEGDENGAKRHYRLALEKDSDYSPAMLGLAELLPPRSDERLRLLERAADIAPSYRGLIELGDFYRSVRKELDLAYATYLRALERSPKDRTAYKKLQDVCRRMEKYAEAREWSRKWKLVYANKKRVDGRDRKAVPKSEFDEVKSTGRRVLKTLRAHRPGREYAVLVEEAMHNLDDPDRRLQAVKTLQALSHPKGLGDIFIEQVPGFEWPNMVSRLSGAAGDYIRKFDPSVPAGRELGFSQEELAMLTKSTLPTYSPDSPNTQRLPFGRGWSATAVFVTKFILLPVAFVAVVLLLVK